MSLLQAFCFVCFDLVLENGLQKQATPGSLKGFFAVLWEGIIFQGLFPKTGDQLPKVFIPCEGRVLWIDPLLEWMRENERMIRLLLRESRADALLGGLVPSGAPCRHFILEGCCKGSLLCKGSPLFGRRRLKQENRFRTVSF